MPRTPADIARANNEAFSRQDVDAMLELHKPDALVVDRRNVGFGEFPGHDAIRAYYQGLFDNTESIKEDLEVVQVDGDVVIASCHVRASLTGQGGDPPAVTFDYALRVEVDGELIASLEIYPDVATAAGASSSEPL
jgi:ketosteroid isomerase-like protein